MITVTLPKFFQPFYCEDLTRLGKNNDGGYLVNKQDVLNTDSLLSLGIGEDWSFEKDFTDIAECSLNSYDESLIIDKLPEGNALRSQYLAFFNNSKKIHTSKNVGIGINEIPFESTIENYNTFLKCDIEGGEYKILDEIISNSKKFSGMVLKFHDINKQDHFTSLLNFMCKIPQKLVHIHINNYFYYKTDSGCVPDILELTFTASSNISLEKNITLPNKLDMPNNPEGEEFKILFSS